MNLKSAREEIEKIDYQIISLIKKRQECALLIHNAKKEENVPVRDETQRENVINRAVEKAEEEGINKDMTREIFEILIEMNESAQKKY
ncbi:MAG: chorismate mutase [Methanomicrobium sp.]|nr:chorismate mutase [Methanomicrobium sp.]